MKRLVAPLLTISVFAALAFATDTQFKTRIITSATLTIHVRTGQYLTINNFTQQNIGSPSQRGVVIISVNAPTPTPAPTATPTPTPTPSPTPTPTPTPTPITTIVLTAAISGASPAEFIKPVVIAGPAVATVEPVAGAILSITYRKQDQPIQPTPTATSSTTTTTTPSPTSTLSGAEMIFEALPSNDGTTDLPTPTPIPTTPEPLATSTPTPTATPSFTPTPSPIPSPAP